MRMVEIYTSRLESLDSPVITWLGRRCVGSTPEESRLVSTKSWYYGLHDHPRYLNGRSVHCSLDVPSEAQKLALWILGVVADVEDARSGDARTNVSVCRCCEARRVCLELEDSTKPDVGATTSTTGGGIYEFVDLGTTKEFKLDSDRRHIVLLPSHSFLPNYVEDFSKKTLGNHKCPVAHGTTRWMDNICFQPLSNSLNVIDGLTPRSTNYIAYVVRDHTKVSGPISRCCTVNASCTLPLFLPRTREKA
ncbi:hypothetical protein JOM56_004788 [Amanita muscaria]